MSYVPSQRHSYEAAASDVGRQAPKRAESEDAQWRGQTCNLSGPGRLFLRRPQSVFGARFGTGLMGT